MPWHPSILAAAFLLALARWPRAEGRTAAFLGYLAAYFAARLLAVLAAAVAAPPLLPSLSGVLADTLGVAAFLSLFFAVDQRPDLAERRGEPLAVAGGVAFLVALLVYFVHVPNLLNPLEYLGSGASELLQLGLDAFFCLRFAHLATRAGAPAWRRVYRDLAVALLLWALGDAVRVATLWGMTEGAAWSAALARVPAAAFRAAGFLPALVAVARVPRRRPAPEPASPAAAAATPVPALVLYAAALPVIHLLLYPVARRIPASYGAREVLTFAYVVVVGGLAAVDHRRRERERRAAGARLRDSERRYRALVDGHPDALAVERDGRIVFRNAGFAALPPPLAAAESLAAAGLAPPAEPVARRHEVRLPVPRGRRALHFEVTHQPIRWQGAPAWQVAVRDLSALDALRRRNRRMARLAQLGELAGSLAAELRVPLADLAERSRRLATRLAADDAQTRDDLELAIERMTRIVDGMDRFSRPPPPELAPADPGELVQAALRSLPAELARRRINLVLDLRHGEATVAVDRHQMLQVLANLLDNALRATPDGGGIALRTRRRDGDGDGAAAGVELVVEDSGDGIAGDDLERIFDPFFTTRDGGTGLGLAVVARILERHGCGHEVESRPGAGTRFRVLFPPPAEGAK